MQQAMMEAGMMIENIQLKQERSHGYGTCFARDSAGRKVISMQKPGSYMTGMKKRDNVRYIITGATGFLGSNIMAGLLLKVMVCHSRTTLGTESLKDRIRKLLAWFGIEHLQGLLRVL